ncbi:TPA: YopX family protein [Streptococcus suis]
MIQRYRAWDKTRNEWSNGFFIYSEGGLYTPDYGFNRKHFKKRTNVYPIVKQERFILMQSTGLFDVNGKEIFEGDVVKLVDEYNDSVVSAVAFQNGASGMTADGIFVPFAAMSILSQVEYTLEIIGNIYENPELVEG